MGSNPAEVQGGLFFNIFQQNGHKLFAFVVAASDLACLENKQLFVRKHKAIFLFDSYARRFRLTSVETSLERKTNGRHRKLLKKTICLSIAIFKSRHLPTHNIIMVERSLKIVKLLTTDFQIVRWIIKDG
jgi:hypothetical protein